MFAEDLLRTFQTLDPRMLFPCLDTPYSRRYSNTNFSAWGHDVTAIREILSQRQVQLNSIDAIINKMKPIYEQLCEKRKEIVSSMTVHEGFISPIRRLPSDILKEIFVRTLPPVERGPTVKAAPLLLTEICRHWREVALDTPRLWCSLKVWRNCRLPDPVQELPFYDDWLTRARGCPLSLTVQISDSQMPRNLGWKEAAIDFAQRHTSRAAELSLLFEEADCLYTLLKDTPALEHLRLNGDLATMSNEPTRGLSLVQPHLRLRTLVIRSLTLGMGTLSVFNPGWTNLTRLAVTRSSKQDLVRDNIFLTLLQMCPNIEHFIFFPLFSFGHENPMSFTHSKLRILNIGHPPYLHPLQGTVTINLPNLRHFIVPDTGYSTLELGNPFLVRHTPWSKEFLVDASYHRALSFAELTRVNLDIFTFLNPGWTNITHLVFKRRVQADDTLLRLLHLCPNLEKLVIFSECFRYSNAVQPPPTPVTHDKIHSLSLKEYSGSFPSLLGHLRLPSLRNLDVVFERNKGTAWPQAEFKQFLSRTCLSLETLTIKGVRISIEEQEELARLVPTLRNVDIPSVV